MSNRLFSNQATSNGHPSSNGHSHSNGHRTKTLKQPRTASRRRQQTVITGGAGFIGTNVAASLLEQDHDVIVYDSLARPGVEDNLRWLQNRYGSRIKVELHDIRDAAQLPRCISHADNVFHFAAQVAVTTSLVDPCFDFDVNARGTLNVLEACRACSTPPRLLFTSTNKVYGGLTDVQLQRVGGRYQPEQPSVLRYGISEKRPLEFHSPYGCSKGAADQYVLDYARCYRIPAVVFRMSCIYGPHQCGTEDQGWVAHFVRAALRGEEITFYGDGCQVRDLLFVDDLVQAMQLAVEHIDETSGNAFNIGGGPANAVSLRELVAQIGELQGTAPRIRAADWREGDQRYYVSDTRMFSRLSGWSPQVDPATGVSRLYHWLQSQHRSTAAAF
jgi:CDP-paratose 2-epimerase